MSSFKNYIIAFMAGVITVLIFMLKCARPVINTDNYIERLDQKNKVKGRENSQTVEVPVTSEKKRRRKRH